MQLPIVIGLTAAAVYILTPSKTCKPPVTSGVDGQTNELGRERIIIPPAREIGQTNLRDRVAQPSVNTSGFEVIRHMLHLDACEKEACHPGRAHVESAVQA